MDAARLHTMACSLAFVCVSAGAIVEVEVKDAETAQAEYRPGLQSQSTPTTRPAPASRIEHYRLRDKPLSELEETERSALKEGMARVRRELAEARQSLDVEAKNNPSRVAPRSDIFFNGKRIEGRLPPLYYESRATCLDIHYGLELAFEASCWGQLETAVAHYTESVHLMMDTGYTREDKLEIALAHAGAHWSINEELPGVPLQILADAARDVIAKGRYDEEGLLFLAIKSLKLWKWPFGEYMLVHEGKVGEGFTEEQVRFVLGDPMSKHTIKFPDGRTCDRWVYEKGHADFHQDSVIAVKSEGDASSP